MFPFLLHQNKNPPPVPAAGSSMMAVGLLSVHSYPLCPEDTRERVCSMRPVGKRGKHRSHYTSMPGRKQPMSAWVPLDEEKMGLRVRGALCRRDATPSRLTLQAKTALRNSSLNI